MKVCEFNWEKTYDGLYTQTTHRVSSPLIGITGNFGEKGCELAEGYYRSVLECGGTPVIIPPYTDPHALVTLVQRLDGIIFSGGGDMNPLFAGEEPIPELHGINHKRDLAELLLVRAAYDHQIPMLGICRGMQMIVSALKGTVYQDLYKQQPDKTFLKHNQELHRGYASHSIQIEPDSLLYLIYNKERLAVNSFHHQAVKETGPLLRTCATAPDGTIEAVASNEYKSILGVQWHPECFILEQDTSMIPIFEWLINEATSFACAKTLHQNIITLDSHCDTPMHFHKNIQFDRHDDRVLVDFQKMKEGKLDAVIMVAYLEQKERTEEGLQEAFTKADSLLTQIEEMVNHVPNLELARTTEELELLKKKGKKAIMKGIENGYAIGKDLQRLHHFHNRGIVYMTLCHNGDNDICDSARGKREHGGLSAFGKEVVREMNRLGILVDLSHASEESFYQALELSEAPIVCSHSSCRSLCDVPRNLTDNQLRALAAKGGVAQVTLYKGFLQKDKEASIKDVMLHLNHMVNIMGINHVGIGTDFDGDGGVPGCASASEVINLTRQMLQEGYSQEDIEKIWGGNFLRVMQQVQKHS